MGSGETAHSAAGSALGYLYQCYVPLLQLAQRSADQPELVLKMELFDDVQFDQAGIPKELIQTKHHPASRGDLRDTSVDLWRTINAWISAIEQLNPTEVPALTLLTTTAAKPGSAAAVLRDDAERDAQHALELLRTAALASVNQTTQRWRTRFIRLTSVAQDTLVSAITIADGAVTFDQFDEELARELRWALPGADLADAFIEHVKGWWFDVALRLLRRDITAFAAADMLAAIQDIRDQFTPDNLPTDPELPNPDAGDIAEYEERAFVHQLKLIATTDEQLALAIRDCYRAFTQRSRWLRRELIGVNEIDRFEKRLVEDWEFVFTNLTAELDGGAEEGGRQKCGREILAKAAETAKARIRDRYEESFLTRGSLHLLADHRRVGWHPDFEARLEALLGPVVNAV